MAKKIKISKKDFDMLAYQTAEDIRKEHFATAPHNVALAWATMIIDYKIRLAKKLFDE